MSEPLVLTSDQPPIRRPGVWLAGVALYILLISIGAGVGGELGIFTTASFNALPFVGLAILAYFAGSQFNWAWIATGLWLALVLGLAALYTFGLGVIPLLDMPPGGISPEQAPTLSPADVLSIVLLILGIFVALGIGLLTLLPPVRRGLAQVLPIDPDSFVHAVAVMAIVSITLMMFVPLLVAGEPPLLALINTVGGEEFSDLSADEQLRSQIYGLVWTIPAAFLAVGFGIRRNLAATLERLGLARPTLRHLAIGIGIGLGLAGLMSLALPLMDTLWQALGWPTTDEEAFGELMAFAISPIGALVIGVTAGLGEELGVRGVLQPRLGIWLSNLFFTSLHAFQYNWDALLVVFVIGMVCGLVRKHTNTTTAAIVHGVYNFVMVMLTVVFGM
ncbi:CPBP family intramembrane glutamic endopeptidase [Chloroflexus sp.]|uniref:CPBP family intramembrane glutamic endopeptidase n=1 Tax=Chloroflexus sp. TaxID=1904827 RepID=UPI00298ED8B6|nr:CPBP family intramembrane glutamic endopeptidase [Chloroflexus sp.]MDW8405482.1 CPBP family intramembrane glutamic endopeptidase [Chloroflexus sp.]